MTLKMVQNVFMNGLRGQNDFEKSSKCLHEGLRREVVSRKRLKCPLEQFKRTTN